MSIVSKFGGSGLPREVLSAVRAVVTTNGKKSAEVVVVKKSL